MINTIHNFVTPVVFIIHLYFKFIYFHSFVRGFKYIYIYIEIDNCKHKSDCVEIAAILALEM